MADLMKMKSRIDKEKEELSQLKGRERVLKERLQHDWDCDTVEDADAKRKEMDKQIIELEKDLSERGKKLEDKLEAIDNGKLESA